MNASGPLKSGSGTYVMVPSGFTVAVPLFGWLITATVVVSNDPTKTRSLARTAIAVSVSSSMSTKSSMASG